SDEGAAGLAAEIEQCGSGIIVDEGARRLAREQPAEGGIALAEARDVAVDATLVVVEDRAGVRSRHIERDKGLDLAPGARLTDIEEDLRLLARENPFRAARMRDAGEVGWIGNRRFQRDARQI